MTHTKIKLIWVLELIEIMMDFLIFSNLFWKLRIGLEKGNMIRYKYLLFRNILIYSDSRLSERRLKNSFLVTIALR